MIKKILFTTILFATILFSQNYKDALLPFYGFKGSQSIGIGLGDATVAAGQIMPEFTNNPANLGLQRFRTLGFTYTSNEFNSGSNSLPQSSFGTLNFIYPLMVFRGSVVFATSWEKEREFALSYQGVDEYGNFKQRNEGEIRKFHFAFSTEISDNLFIGADVMLPYGNIDISIEYPDAISDTMGYTQNNDYSGVEISIGILQRISKHINWGVSVDFPKKINITEDFTYNDGYSLGERDYSSTKPLTVRAGAGILFKYINFFYEAEWTNWKNIEFASDNLLSSDVIDINEEIETNLSQTIFHKIGTAIHTPFIPLHLYAGYQILPEPHSDENRNVISGGFSYLIKQQISIHGSYQMYYWDHESNGSTLSEDWNQIILGTSLHF